MSVPARQFRTPLPAPAGIPDPLEASLDLAALIAIGWDPATAVLCPDAEHPLLGYPRCRVAGCGNETWHASGVCLGCRARFDAGGGTDLDEFCAAGAARAGQSRPPLCLVCCEPGFERPATASGLCFACDGQRRHRGQSARAYIDGDSRYPPAAARPGLGVCAADTCTRVAARPANRLCGAHDAAWKRAGRPDLATFCCGAAPCLADRAGRAVLAGLDERVTAEVLHAVQVSLAEGRRVMIRDVRGAVEVARRAGVTSLAEIDTAGRRDPLCWFVRFAADRAALARSCSDTERVKDVWDLRVWGATGRLSFVGSTTRVGTPSLPISQAWLRQASKAWAAEALVSVTAGPVRATVGAIGLLSESLARRADGGADPAAIDHRDVEAFLARLGRLVSAGQLSAERRTRSIELLGRFLRDCRETGLTAPGGPAAGLADDVAVRRAERPRVTRHDDEVGRALPEAVMAQLLSVDSLAVLETLAGPSVRAAIELGAGVGRRTGELCSLAWGCLDYDDHAGSDGQVRPLAVLVHDMPKVGKFGCRLPIHDREAVILSAQQARVAAAFPHTPTTRLALFPRPLKNPDGTHPISTAQLQRAMRAWVTALPRLDSPDTDPAGRPVPFPRDQVIPYSLRHSFAQRHADAGTPVDTLKELLGHDTVRTTLGYYRVTARRKREAQDRLGPLQLNARGHLVRPALAALGDTDLIRDQVGQVAVPFGICTEPTNVAADGHSCPFRHRCTGCEYFRTDPSYQPELGAYLGQLLADRERLSTALPQLADWARRDAVPSDGEIDAVRRLLRANDEALASLDDDDRAAVNTAISTIRKQRATLQTTFPVALRGIVAQSTPALFPTIEADGRPAINHG